MKLLVMFLSQFLLIFQNPLENEANYKTNKKSKRLVWNGWLFKAKEAKSYKMHSDSVFNVQNIFFKKYEFINTKGANYKMPNN
jgi:hypothetical protein